MKDVLQVVSDARTNIMPNGPLKLGNGSLSYPPESAITARF